MKRALGIFESTQVIINTHYAFNVVIVLKLDGAPEPEVVKQAAEILQGRHPLLRARIVEDGHQYWFDFESSAPIPFLQILRSGEEAWVQVVEEELSTGFDTCVAPLIRLTYLRPTAPGGEAELVLTLQHVIIDASSGSALVAELLGLCQALSLGNTPQAPVPLPVLAPAEDYFPKAVRGIRGWLKRLAFMARQITDEITYQHRVRGGRQLHVYPSGRPKILSVQLPTEHTSALIRRCRRERITLHSVINAALLLVVNRRLYGGNLVSMRNFNFANLRPYLEPPLRANHLGSYFAMIRLTTEVGAQKDLWTLARELNRESLETGKRGDKYMNVLFSRMAIAMIFRNQTMRLANTALSYTGPAQIPQTFGGIHLTGLHGFVSNFVRGPEYTAQVRLFADRIWWDIVYLDCDMDEAVARQLAEDLLSLLQIG